jgi:hypothetical protein
MEADPEFDDERNIVDYCTEEWGISVWQFKGKDPVPYFITDKHN